MLTYSDICMVVVRNNTTYLFIDQQNIQEKVKITERIQRMLGGRIWEIGVILGYLVFGDDLRILGMEGSGTIFLQVILRVLLIIFQRDFFSILFKINELHHNKY